MITKESLLEGGFIESDIKGIFYLASSKHILSVGFYDSGPKIFIAEVPWTEVEVPIYNAKTVEDLRTILDLFSEE